LRVTVSIYAVLREVLGWKSRVVEIEGRDRATLREVLQRLPELFERVVDGDRIAEGYIVFVNGVHAQFVGGLDAVIEDSASIDVFPPGGGG